MTEILLWSLLFFGSGFAGGFVGVVAGVVVVHTVKRYRRRMPTWANHDHDWRGR
jgi:hypothetical protein